MPQNREKPWVIREADEDTRTIVKVYATKHHLTMAEALSVLVKAGKERLEGAKGRIELHISGDADEQEVRELTGSATLPGQDFDIPPDRMPAVLQVLAQLVARELQKDTTEPQTGKK